MSDVEERLWMKMAELGGMLAVGTAHTSDVFALLACILAFYQARGTSPDEMIASPRLRAMIETVSHE